MSAVLDTLISGSPIASAVLHAPTSQVVLLAQTVFALDATVLNTKSTTLPWADAFARMDIYNTALQFPLTLPVLRALWDAPDVPPKEYAPNAILESLSQPPASALSVLSLTFRLCPASLVAAGAKPALRDSVVLSALTP